MKTLKIGKDSLQASQSKHIGKPILLIASLAIKTHQKTNPIDCEACNQKTTKIHSIDCKACNQKTPENHSFDCKACNKKGQKKCPIDCKTCNQKRPKTTSY